MKKILLSLVFVLIMCCTLALVINAETITVTDDGTNIILGDCVIEGLDREIPKATSGFTYSLNTETKIAKITKWDNYADKEKGAVFCVPSTVTYSGETYTVTGFSRVAYGTDDGKGQTNQGNFLLTHVYIPDTVTSLPASAFENCKALEYVYIGSGLETLGEKSFSFAGTTVGSYYVTVEKETTDETTGETTTTTEVVQIEKAGGSMGDIKEFIVKSTKIRTLPKQVFMHTEFANDAIIEFDINSITTYESQCIALNGYALTTNHHFNGTGIRFDVWDLRNATSIATDAFYFAAGAKLMILNAEQTKYFNANSIRGAGANYYNEDSGNDGYFIIYGGETADTAKTLGGPVWTANAHYWYGSTVFMNFVFKGYVNAYDGTDGLENQNSYGIDQVDYFFESKDALDHYIASIESTTNKDTTYTRYAKNTKGYFTVCDNTNGHSGTAYNLTYTDSVAALEVVTNNSYLKFPTYVANTTSATCIEDGYDIYKCRACENDYNKVSVEAALGHNYDLDNGATLAAILYENGFDKNGVKCIKCSRCDEKDKSISVPAFIRALGYSVPEDDPYAGLCAGYEICDREAYNAYVDSMGEISFGIVISNAIGASTLIEFEGDNLVCTAEKALMVEMTDEYSIFNVLITGFNESMAQSLNLIIATYMVADYDGNGEDTIKYVQHTMTNEDNLPEEATGLGLNTVSLNRAFYNLYPAQKPIGDEE